MKVFEQLELSLGDTRLPWNGRSPRELTKSRLRFSRVERTFGGTGRAHQDADALESGPPQGSPGGVLQYSLFDQEVDHAFREGSS